jgi:hypothetical protein
LVSLLARVVPVDAEHLSSGLSTLAAVEADAHVAKSVAGVREPLRFPIP